MKSKGWLLTILMVVGCNLPPDLPPAYFFGDNTAVCAGAEAISYGTELTFTVDVVILSGYSRDYALEYLEAPDISFAGNGQYGVQSVAPLTLPARVPGPVAVLVDQHQSYAYSDSTNFRSKQINQFLHELPASAGFRLGGFSEGGLLAESPVEFATPSFTTDPNAVMPFLFGLAKRTGGLSVLFDAAQETLGSFPPGPNRSLIVVAQGHDSLSTVTLSDVVNTAASQAVKVDVIYLGTIQEAQKITPLSLSTGGLFVYCATDKNLVTAFNHMNNFYINPVGGFRVTVKFTPPGPLASGEDTFHEMIIHDSLDDVDFNSIPLLIRVP